MTLVEFNEYPESLRWKRIDVLRAREASKPLTGFITSDALALGPADCKVCERERAALRKAEDATLKPALAHLDALADPLASTADREAAGIADAKAMLTLYDVAAKASRAAEENHDAVTAAWDALREDHGAAMVDYLSQAHEEALPHAVAEAAVRAMNDNNPSARLRAPGPGRMVGGVDLPNLLAKAERVVGLLPAIQWVAPTEYAKLQRGLEAVTIDGDPVEGGRPVRVRYSRPLLDRETALGAG